MEGISSWPDGPERDGAAPWGRSKGPGAGPEPGGFSLLELLISMTLLATMAVLLAELFAFSAETWSNQAGGLDVAVDLQAGADVLRSDLAAAYPGRPAMALSFDPDHGNLAHLREDSELLYEAWFQNRMRFPFEVDRTAGNGDRVSLPHAEPREVDGRKVFSTLAFAAVKPDAGAMLPTALHEDRFGALAPLGGDPVEPAEFCLIGYYVAYTKDSPLTTDPGSSFKLYRHVRPAAMSLGIGQAGSTLRAFATRFREQHLPGAEFANRDLDFFFAYHSPHRRNPKRVAGERPWPRGGEYEPAGVRPSRDELGHWKDPDSTLYDYLFGDAPLIQNVVRFQVRPYKRVLVGGTTTWMDTAELVDHLQLPDPDWPVLVLPDMLDVIVSVIPPDAAAKLTRKEDWLVSWDGDQPVAEDTAANRVIRATVRTRRFQVHLPSDP